MFFNITTDLIKNSSISGNLSNSQLYTSFPNCNFCWKAPSLSMATNLVSCFPWSDRFSSFLRKCLPNIQIWMIIVCSWVILSDKNAVPWKKVAVQLIVQLHKYFSSRQSLTIHMQQKCFVHISDFIIQNIKKMCTQRSIFNIINNFCFFKHILMWNWYSFPPIIGSW